MDPLSIAAVGWLMSALVSKAVTALLEAWTNRIGLGNEFKILKDQLLQLGALLTSARSLRTNNSFLEELAQNLQQLAYRAENLLDELDYYRLEDQIQQRGTQEKVNCITKSSVASSSSGFRLASRSILSTLKGASCHSTPDVLVPLPKTFSSRINLSRRMNELAEQLKKSEEKVRYALQTESLVITARNTEINQTEATNLRQTSSFLTEPKVFGIDQERDKLMNLLTDEECSTVGKVPVVAIVGSGGVGKTTLAQLLFNDPKVHSYFEVRLWICVSNRFDIFRLTREMLEGTCGDRYDELSNLNVLQNELKQILEYKKFLLVLDDMWEDEDKKQWDLMVAPLNYCRIKGSIILVTTRNQSVAKMVDAKDKIYMQGLKNDAFLSFFSTCIFNEPNYGGNRRLRNIGEQIANKMKGNPLAAKTVSALLKENIDERYWIKIRDREEWKSQSGTNDIMPALRLSYEHMPFHLQRCFSYTCAMFSKDYPFTLKEMVYLWMAQGFLDEKSDGKRMEDIGSAYFTDLVNRGFFQTQQSPYDGLVHYNFHVWLHESEYGVVYYTCHDLIHDLACMLSFKECLSIDSTEPRQIPPTIRHLSIFNSTKNAEPEEAIVRAIACLEGENLSTIINWDELPYSGIFQSISDLLKETKFLRAMRLTICFKVQQHKFIQNFVSLRYLRLGFKGSQSKVWYITNDNLPREICRLYHLEVLEIVNGQFLELPNNFSDLVSLRHFIVVGKRHSKLHSKICGVGKLTSLQELNHFDAQQKIGFEIEQLGSLKQIGGSLHIWNLQNVKSMGEAGKASLADRENLDALYLHWNCGDQENESVLEGLKPNTNLKSLGIDGYGGVASPTWWEPSLKFLESLTLENCKAWELLPPIGELELLKHLKLSGLPLREIGPQCYGTRESMKFPSLKELEIINMPDLEKWVRSDQLQLFLCLKKLTIKHCTKLVDLPLSGCATSEVLERFPSLESLEIIDCPLVFQQPPLPYSSLLSFIYIANTGFIEYMYYTEQKFSLGLNKCSRLKVGELLASHELRSLRVLKISNISGLKSLDLNSLVALENLLINRCQSLISLTFGDHLIHLRRVEIMSCKTLSSIKGLKSLVALENLVINGCQSLISLAFGEHLIHLRRVEIISCKTLSSIKSLKSWVNLKELHFRECPGFIAAWDLASKEIERTEPDFSLSLILIESDSFALLTLPICKQLTSLKCIYLKVSAFTEEHEVSAQLLTSIDLVDIEGCKRFLQSFPFDLFPSLKALSIKFPRIRSLTTGSRNEITEECMKLRNIEQVDISHNSFTIKFKVSSEEMISQQVDADN